MKSLCVPMYVANGHWSWHYDIACILWPCDVLRLAVGVPAVGHPNVGPPTNLVRWYQREVQQINSSTAPNACKTDLGGPRGKGSPSVSKGPKPPIQLLQLLKNSPREVKRAQFRYIPVRSPGPTQEIGPEGKVAPGPPRFLQPCPQLTVRRTIPG